MSQQWILLLRPGQFTKKASHVATLFICHNQSFFYLRRDIHHLVAIDTSSFNVVTYITLSRQRSFSEALLLSQQAFFLCCNNQCHDRRSLVATEFLLYACFICRDKSFFVATGVSLSRQFLSGVDILLKNLVTT